MRYAWRLASVLIIATAAAAWFLLLRAPWQPTLGITYSDSYAAYLKLPADAYVNILNDLKPEHIRLPLYWDALEAKRGEYDFSLIEQHLADAAARHIPVTLAIGLKVPRFPECFVPAWARALPAAERDQALLEYMATAAEKLGSQPGVVAIQVENEPWFPFGDCPAPDPERFKAEVALMREILPGKIIQTTVSGEQDVWALRGQGIDRVGASLYRMAWNKYLGPIAFFYPARFYVLQSLVAELTGTQVMFSELQAEPWFAPGQIIPDELRYTAWDLRTSLLFTRLIGIKNIDLWGVEWWYHGKEIGWGTDLWNEAVRQFNSVR